MSKEIYTPENVPLFEAMYGPGLISLGGYEAIDQMFKGIDIHKKQLLDVGSGIGGMAYYLADHYHAFVTGIEIHSWMARYAINHTPETIHDNVNFITYTDEGFIPLPSQTVDVVCSKGVLTNVSEKRELFLELYRVLTATGQLCLMDWMVPEEKGPQNKTLPYGEISCKETQSSYQQILTNCGFVNMTFENESESYLKYAKSLGLILASEKFSNFANRDLQEILIASNNKLIHDIESGDQMSVRICAKKR